MKKNLLYIHGGGSYSKQADFLQFLQEVPLRDLPGSEAPKRWSQSLAEDLGPDFMVYAPSMPNKQNARFEEWKIWFERYLALVSSSVTLVGWSLGGMFLVKYLVENVPKVEIEAVHLIAAPAGDIVAEGGEDCCDFAFLMSDLPRLESRVGEIVLWYSKDDIIVPYSEGEKYKKVLKEAKFNEFIDRGHFLLSEFPELVKALKGS